jgi:GxxExxY protein
MPSAEPLTEHVIGLAVAFKADIVVACEAILEVKAISAILPVHELQLRTYLRISGVRIGLLLNVTAPRLIDGLRHTWCDAARREPLSPWSP